MADSHIRRALGVLLAVAMGACSFIDTAGLARGERDAQPGESRPEAGIADAAVPTEASDAGDAASSDAMPGDAADAGTNDATGPTFAAPRVLARSQPGPREIAADTQSVAWVNEGPAKNQGSVMLLNLGDAGLSPLAQGQASPRFVALAASRVYWTSDEDGTGWTYVRWVARTGSTNVTWTFGNSEGSMRFSALSVDGAQHAVVSQTFRDEIWRGDVSRPTGEATAQEIVTVGTTVGSISGLFLHLPYAYWSQDGTILRSTGAGDASAPETLTQGVSGGVSLAIDDPSLFFASQDGILKAIDDVEARPVQVRSIARGLRGPTQLTVDKTFVYAILSGSSRVVALERTTGIEHELARDLKEPFGLAVTDKSVFVTDRSDGVVYAIDKQ